MKSYKPDPLAKFSEQTRLVHQATGYAMPDFGLKTVNPPIHRGSTLLYDNCESVLAWREQLPKTGRVGYGLSGSDLTLALEGLMAELDGGTEAIATGSGLSAVALAMSAFLSAGDQILVADNVYGPARNYADRVLVRFGVEVTYFDPMDLPALEALVQPNAKVLYFELPGSLTFEVPDAAALYKLATVYDLITIVDSTWPTSLYYPALARGADVSLAAGTKYYAGHSDVFFGIVISDDRRGVALRKHSALLGNYIAPDDAYLSLRGMRTLKVRLDAISKSAWQVATFLKDHPLVQEVRHPALPSCPGHEHWKAQFDGASGLFGVFLDPKISKAGAERLVETLELFGIGYSWGGYESLAVVPFVDPFRSVRSWREASTGKGPLLRLQIGLEDPADLIADLTRALDLIA